MEQFLTYLHSSEFAQFLTQTGVPLVLSTMVLSFIALLLEIRLPMRYYWGLPGYTMRSVLRGFHLMAPIKTWGRCYDRENGKPIPLVACELMDEASKKLVMRTYSNHQGSFGFSLRPGRYLLRAVKTRYRLPSLLDPENVELYEIDESFAVSIAVLNQRVVPVVDLPLVPVKKILELTHVEAFWHYMRTFLFQLGNVFLLLDVILALLGYAATQDLFYGLILAVAVVLLFTKLYVLETISVLTKVSYA
jgi:hypothetical protein